MHLVAGKTAMPQVRFDKIGPEHFRPATTETELYREPGGWIADDIPIRKGESAHPKGVQPQLRESTGHPRVVLKIGMTEADLAKITPTRDRKGNRQ